MRNTHIAETLFQHTVLDALYLDDGAFDIDLQRLIDTLTHHGQSQHRTRLATHDFNRFTQRQSFYRHVVKADNQVASLDTGSLSGRIVYGCNDFDKAVFHTDFDTEPAELTGGTDLQLLELFLIKVGGMWIQARQHAANGVFQHVLVRDFLDIVVLDTAEYITEGPQLLYRQSDGWTVFAFREYTLSDRDGESGQYAGQYQENILSLYTHSIPT